MDPVEALTTCRSYEDACEQAGTGAVERAIRSMHWAIMAAPDIYLLIAEWMQVKRIDDAEQDLIDGRLRLMAGLRDPEVMTIVEMAAPPKHVREAMSEVTAYSTIKTGPDVLSVRAQALSKNVEAHMKVATGRLKLHESLMRRIQHAVWRIGEIGKRPATADQIRAQVMGYIANTDPKLDAAIAFARVWTPPTLTTWRDDGDVFTRIDASTGQPLEDGVQQALPAVMGWLDKLKAQRERLVEAGDMAGMAQADGVIREHEQREQDAARTAEGRRTDEDDRAELERLRSEQG